MITEVRKDLSIAIMYAHLLLVKASHKGKFDVIAVGNYKHLPDGPENVCEKPCPPPWHLTGKEPEAQRD